MVLYKGEEEEVAEGIMETIPLAALEEEEVREFRQVLVELVKYT
jgi:hypothetical protein